MAKKRLDVILVEKGLFESREKAKSAIMAGAVYVNNNKEDKPGALFDEDADIVVRENLNPFVSRGGLKLDKALKAFNIDVKGVVALDIGASTGGFTDCLLKNGASKVFAIDVGYGQLAWELRQNEKVKVMERTNIRYVKPEDIGEPANFACIDVSFISLKKVLPVVHTLLLPESEVVCLIKPQFEAGRDKVGKKGVVRDSEIHKSVVEEMAIFAMNNGFVVKGLDFSPIKGPEGNIEFLMHIRKADEYIEQEEYIRGLAQKTVQDAHEKLD
ncbi:MAG TPA: TlyA family RNA methyltransferase [Clostridiaceae bacterium]|nr:TlyA family RNA methyltransferase [Clostridiaceae bacterium]